MVKLTVYAEDRKHYELLNDFSGRYNSGDIIEYNFEDNIPEWIPDG